MTIAELLLTLLTFSTVVGIPVYIYYRSKMSDISRTHHYSRKRIMKDTLINLTLNSIVSFIFILIWGSLVLSAQKHDPQIIALTILFFIIMGLIFYGNGIYITSIVIEAFTHSQLKKNESFETQFLALHLFHGPISHILIYSGYILLLFTLGILDLQSNTTPSLIVPQLFILGIIMGIMFAYAQKINGTFPYQLITSFITLIILSFYGITIFNYSIAAYVLGFSLAVTISSLTYLLLIRKSTRNIWNLSG